MAAAASDTGELGEHYDQINLEAMHQLVDAEPHKSVIAADVVRKSVGPDLDGWKLAAHVEHDAFVAKEALQEATTRDKQRWGKRPLPMLNVWSQTDTGLKKCRTCIAGNQQVLDPTAQRWTAQAEPSSVFLAAKMAAMRRWKISKLDVKGAFLNAPLSDDELILVQPPTQWVQWGIVEPGTIWKLRKAVDGLRQSPNWWGRRTG